ncbi:ROK family protein [Parabacteroides bouchesdurhonensis]|uniref:ROK family protein n=1 Tax=Parabacteroides bouchesdurhonensis TaxID=1936995 RepID=UPI000E488B9C|nr:ROK family protein [Parabacteroides bouchesdurhonensis]RHJ95193.1 ROK family protein [Bacteroides sp. AM07-16]
MGKGNSNIGVDLGGTNMRAGRIMDGILVAKNTIPTPKQAKSCEETLSALINVIRSVWDDGVKAIGIGVPSVVDRKSGIVYNVVNIPHWEEVHLKEILEKEFSVPVHIDNDANCFALGERIFGDGQDVENFVGLTLGTGLGGGIIQQGRLLADANCGSGEFGMLPYKDKILEYYCSGSYFMNVWGVDGKDMYSRAVKGDAEALEAYRQLGIHVAAAIKIVVLTVDPEMIIFGGSVAATHELFEESMRENLKDFDYPNSIKKLQIRYSTMEDPGIIGAASLCY